MNLDDLSPADRRSWKLLLETLRGDEARARRIIADAANFPGPWKPTLRNIANDPARYERGPRCR